MVYTDRVTGLCAFKGVKNCKNVSEDSTRCHPKYYKVTNPLPTNLF